MVKGPTWLSSICRPPSSSRGLLPTRSTSGMPTRVPTTFTPPAAGRAGVSLGEAHV